jgi:hypothetical protein
MSDSRLEGATLRVSSAKNACVVMGVSTAPVALELALLLLLLVLLLLLLLLPLPLPLPAAGLEERGAGCKS